MANRSDEGAVSGEEFDTRIQTRSRRAGRRRTGMTSIVLLAGAMVIVVLAVGALSLAAFDGGPITASAPVAPVPSPTATPTVETTAVVEPMPTPIGAEVLPPIAPRLVKGVPGAGKRVALTFDLCERDGDTAGYDDGIVNVLLETDTPATFFMGGKWAESHPDEAAYLGGQALFEIGNHSWSHENFKKIDEVEMLSEVVDAQAAIARLTGRTPRLWRFPYGPHPARALEMVADQGLVAIEWDVVTGDPDKNVHADDIVRAVKTETEPGSIIIMHANGRGWHTAEALPNVIKYLRGAGYEIVSVGELIQ